MKKFNQLLLTTAIFLALHTTARAQLKGFSIGPYVEAALPLDRFADAFKSGIGAGLSADVKLPLTSLGLTASGGYLHFMGKADSLTLDAIPVRAGLRYKLSVFYLKLEAGAASITNNGGTAFLLSPGIGLRLLGLDIQAKYETWSLDKEKRAFAGLTVGYHF